MRHALLFALALCAAPLSALAQEAPVPLERDDDLAPPELPEVPEALRASVDALRATVQGTEECFTGEGRMEHTPDARCPQWYARLARGGVAAVFAIGEVLRPVRSNPNDPPGGAAAQAPRASTSAARGWCSSWPARSAPRPCPSSSATWCAPRRGPTSTPPAPTP